VLDPVVVPTMSLFGLGRNQRTFRPKKSTPSGSKGAQLRKHIDATLGSGNLREAVRLPPGEDLFEWLAVNSKILLRFVLLLRERERERAIKILLRFIDS
jgi:MOB kinase activator 1